MVSLRVSTLCAAQLFQLLLANKMDGTPHQKIQEGTQLHHCLLPFGGARENGRRHSSIVCTNQGPVIHLIKCLWSPLSKKFLHGLKHNIFPLLTKVVFLITQIDAIPHVGRRRAMRERHYKHFNIWFHKALKGKNVWLWDRTKPLLPRLSLGSSHSPTWELMAPIYSHHNVASVCCFTSGGCFSLKQRLLGNVIKEKERNSFIAN